MTARATGYALAIGTALLLAGADTLTRQLFRREPAARARDVTALRLLLAVPALLAVVPWVGAVPGRPAFWLVVVAGVPLEVGALVLYVHALRVGTLSVSLPLLSLTPALLLVTGPLIAGDAVRPAAVPGVLAIAAGAWALHLGELRHGWLAPFRALARDRGARTMLLVAVVYSVTAALVKRGVVLSDPATMAVVYFLAVAVVGVPALGPKPAELRRLVGARTAVTLGMGALYGLHQVAHMAAVARIPVPEMIALKRLSLLFAALAGVWLLGEEAPRGRIAGGALMVAGAAWIGLAG